DSPRAAPHRATRGGPRPRPGVAPALPPQRLGRRHRDQLHPRRGWAVARAAGPRRPRARHVRPGRVRGAAAPLPRGQLPGRRGGDLHPPRLFALDGAPGGRAHLRAAALGAGPARAHDSRERGGVLRRGRGPAGGPALHRAHLGDDRPAPPGRPRAAHPLPRPRRQRARRRAGGHLAHPARQHRRRPHRHPLGHPVLRPLVAGGAPPLSAPRGRPRGGARHLAGGPPPARRAAPPRPALPLAPAARAPAGPRDADSRRHGARRRRAPAAARVVRGLRPGEPGRL
ncbi:MAG: hypothetical protein AVDCRST_MAG40-1421, partial [uncultured Gemmatimonadaceae bacterium]